MRVRILVTKDKMKKTNKSSFSTKSDKLPAEDRFFYNTVETDLEDFYSDSNRNHVTITNQTEYNKDN